MHSEEEKDVDEKTDAKTDADDIKSVLDELSESEGRDSLHGEPLLSEELVNVETPAEVSEPDKEGDSEVRYLLNQFKNVTEQVLENYGKDRNQIEDTIKHLECLVFNNPKAPRVYVEMLVAALRTKADTSTTTVKLLDSFAKLLSAGKGTQIFVQQSNVGIGQDLKKLLDTPEYPDEADKTDEADGN